MKGWVVTWQGNPQDVLTLRTDMVQPTEPAKSSIIVQVSHAALNPADVNFIQVFPTLIPFRRHPTPGLDFSGRIVAKGSQVPDHLALGDEVCGALPVFHVALGVGTLVEYLEISYGAVAPRPKEMSLEASAGLGIAVQTALLMLKSRPIGPGDRILIQGASGGVGTMLVQLASATKAYVVGICSEANADMVKQLGAKDTVDYTKSTSLADLIREKHTAPFDVVFNCVGDSDLYSHCHKFLKPEGAYVDIANPRGPVVSYWRTLSTHYLPRVLGGSSGIKYKTVNLAPSGDLQREVVEFVNRGVIHQVPIDSKYPMDQALEAFARVESKHAKGKVLVEM